MNAQRGEQSYSSTLSLTSALDGMDKSATPQSQYLRKRKPVEWKRNLMAHGEAREEK